MKKKIIVLGSTGSIGRQTLDVIRSHPDRFEVIALAAGKNLRILKEQIQEFHPGAVGVSDENEAKELASDLPKGIELFSGKNSARELAAFPDGDIVVNGVSGFAGTAPLLSALRAGKTVALANKESIVCAHAIVEKAKSFGGTILPVDSEQSAIFQCLRMGQKSEISRLILTASGGPFRELSKEQLRLVTPEQALCHPTWSMGKKVTLDSATLFNKGLEIMEASYLFHVPGEQIEVLIHPESVVHSMVGFCDGCVAAQMSVPDMRLAIQYALTYPSRIEGRTETLNLAERKTLSFFEPDTERFPSIPLAYAALREGKSLPVVYNAANEAAGKLFLEGKIGFTEIAESVEYAMCHAESLPCETEEEILFLDSKARETVINYFGK